MCSFNYVIGTNLLPQNGRFMRYTMGMLNFVPSSTSKLKQKGWKKYCSFFSLKFGFDHDKFVITCSKCFRQVESHILTRMNVVSKFSYHIEVCRSIKLVQGKPHALKNLSSSFVLIILCWSVVGFIFLSFNYFWMCFRIYMCIPVCVRMHVHLCVLFASLLRRQLSCFFSCNFMSGYEIIHCLHNFILSLSFVYWQVEARIVVLCVLWKIREGYRTGKIVLPLKQKYIV